jgi:hypothetical protein
MNWFDELDQRHKGAYSALKAMLDGYDFSGFILQAAADEMAGLEWDRSYDGELEEYEKAAEAYLAAIRDHRRRIAAAAPALP